MPVKNVQSVTQIMQSKKLLEMELDDINVMIVVNGLVQKDDLKN